MGGYDDIIFIMDKGKSEGISLVLQLNWFVI